jgi:c-di-AMP phosphodiesterase-like protein
MNNICMKCLAKESTHSYSISDRGYGSKFDGDKHLFQVCDDCDEPDYEKWFNESPPKIDMITVKYEKYQFEDNIKKLIHILPLMSYKKFYYDEL